MTEMWRVELTHIVSRIIKTRNKKTGGVNRWTESDVVCVTLQSD